MGEKGGSTGKGEMKKPFMFIPVIKLKEGGDFPRFYLPIRSCLDRYAVEAWFFPLAPLVLLLRVFESMFWAVWADLNEFIHLQYHKHSKPKKVKE